MKNNGIRDLEGLKDKVKITVSKKNKRNSSCS
jgi:hypothetical protein